MAVIASQFAIVASPIAAAVVACVIYLEPQHITMADVLKVTVPSTILGIGLACIFVNKLGKELKDDPHYQTLLHPISEPLSGGTHLYGRKRLRQRPHVLSLCLSPSPGTLGLAPSAGH